VTATARAAWAAFTERANAEYQAAVVRIGFALCFGGFLLREWPDRRVLYGDRSPWSFGLAQQMLASNHAFSVLLWSDSRWWFEGVYTASIVDSTHTMKSTDVVRVRQPSSSSALTTIEAV
jgi:hypothetical protein